MTRPFPQMPMSLWAKIFLVPACASVVRKPDESRNRPEIFLRRIACTAR